MSYQPYKLLNKRLPSFLGFFVLFATLAITLILSRNTMLFVTRATVGSNPKTVQITNITDKSFTVTYFTDESALGAVSYGTSEKGDQIALDARDQQTNKPTEYKTHYIQVSNLLASTKYFFTIASGTQTGTNNGVPYEVTTAATNADNPTVNGAVSGSVAVDDGTFPTEGFVTIASGESQIVSALLAADGSYKVDLTQLRSADLGQFITLTPETKLHLIVHTVLGDSKAEITMNEANAVPKIILSKNYDFTLGPDPLHTASSSADEASQSAGFPPADTNVQPVDSPQIVVPVADQKFKDLQPKFQGKALPNTEIDITIHSQKEISATIQSDANGQWEFRPPVTLDPGTHTITISSLDASGIMQKVTRSFVVNAQGSQFVEPSISPVEPTMVTPKPTAVPAVTPTTVPTVSPTRAPSPTIGVTTVPSPTKSLALTPTPVMHPTGSNTFIQGIIGAIAAIGIGTLLFVFTAL